MSAVAVCTCLFLAGCATQISEQPSTEMFTTAVQQTEAAPAVNPKLVIDPNIGEAPTKPPEAPNVAIPGWYAIKLPAGKMEAEVALYNPEENTDWYYLTFELHLKNTDELIFATGLIPPGSYCRKVELSRPLEAGEYEAIMLVQPYRMNDALTPTNNAKANLPLIVE